MSKKLDSILQKTPPATVAISPNKHPEIAEPQLPTKKVVIEEKIVRISIEVPYSLKRQLKQYIADHPSETEKTILLKGLKILGFNIEDKYLYDLRLKR